MNNNNNKYFRMSGKSVLQKIIFNIKMTIKNPKTDK